MDPGEGGSSSSSRSRKKSAKHWEQLCYTLDELTLDGQFAKPSAMIFSILEGVYDVYLGATYDNADSRHSDLEKLSEYAANFTDISGVSPRSLTN